MNKTRAGARAFAEEVNASPLSLLSSVTPFVIPPFPYIADVAEILKGTRVRIGAQNMHWADSGAWTGEISPPMIKDCGATLVEIGHSERRTYFGETDETVALKTAAALQHDLIPLVCIGDTKQEFEAGNTAQALERQVRGLLKYCDSSCSGSIIIAYEPVWSIGEGGVPASPEFANEQHMMIAKLAFELSGKRLPVVYGGSVSALNCRSLACQPHIDGLFIGRSAWNARDYLDIIELVIHSSGDHS